MSLSPALATPRRVVIENARPGRDWNTCGQAAAATVLAHFGVGPFADGAIPANGAAVDALLASHPPDLPFGCGTSAWRIAAALRAHGVPARLSDSGPFALRSRAAWLALRDALSRGMPVPVCVDEGLLGGRPWGVHWAIALACRDGGVLLGNAPRAWLGEAEFANAWRCRALPLTHHHAAVIAG